MLRNFALKALALACLPVSVNACSLCGCGDPLQAAGTTMPMTGQWRLSMDAEYIYMAAQSEGQPGVTESLDQEIIRPSVAFNPADSLALILQVPLVRKDWWTNDPGADLKATTNYGAADIEAAARWFFWQDTDMRARRFQALALSLGSSLPTGNSNITVNGGLIDQHAQVGTGALGPLAGLMYTLNSGAWNLLVNAGYRYRGTNYQGYQFGQSAFFSLGGQYHVADAFALKLALDGRYADYDHDWAAGAIASETGGTVLAVTPGLGWQITQDIGLTGRVQLPVYTNLFGAQSVTPTYDFSIQYLFNP